VVQNKLQQVDNNTASLPLPNGVYTWTVQATDAQANRSSYLTPTTFVVEAGLVFPANPLISPADGITVTTARPTFDWLDASHPSGQALSYTLRLTSSGVVTSVWGQTTTATVIVSQSHYLPLQGLADDHYTWSVEAYDQGGNRSGFKDWWQGF